MEYYLFKQMVCKRDSDELIGEYTSYLEVESKKELDLMIEEKRNFNPLYQKYDVGIIIINCSKEDYEKNKDNNMMFEDLNIIVTQ